jgi:glycoside/pentoside/hexuronide:cation symporter, GPH family
MTATPKLSTREKISYGFGDLASVLYWQTFMVYLTYFYTDVFGLTALAAGTMLGLSRSIDAFFDPVMGMIADRTRTRWGKFRPFLLWMCVPFAIAGVLTFSKPGASVAARLEAWFGPAMKAALGALSSLFNGIGLASMGSMARDLGAEVSGGLIWAIITYNLLMILYTAVNIPYTAMLGVLTPDPDERTALSSVKFSSAFIAGIIISAGLLFLSKGLGRGNEPRGWQLAFVIVGIAAVVFFLVTFLNTRERVSPPPAQKTSALRDLGDLVTNGPWIILLFTTITFILFVAVRSSVTTHYFKYYVGAQTIVVPISGARKTLGFEWLVSVFNATGQFASLLGAVLVPFYAKRVGRKVAFISLFLVAVGSTAAFYFFRPDQIWLILATNLVGSITGGPLSALIWVMYADTADYSEWKKGRRATGLVFSASIFSQKQGWAIGAAVGLWLLSSVGFKANVGQSAGALHGLVLLMSLIPAAFGVLSVLLVMLYPLSETRVAEIGVELKSRRAAEQPHARPEQD